MPGSHILIKQGLIGFKFSLYTDLCVSFLQRDKQNRAHHHRRISSNPAQAHYPVNSLLSVPVS